MSNLISMRALTRLLSEIIYRGAIFLNILYSLCESTILKVTDLMSSR